MTIASQPHLSKKQLYSLHPLQRLLNYGSEYTQQIWLATICSICNKFFDLAPPALVGIAVDVVVKQKDSIIARLGIQNIFWQFLVLAALTVITWILESYFEYNYELLWRNLAQNIQHNLRVDAYKHLQEMELAYFEERSTGGLMSILSDDINQLERFLNVGANDIIQVTTTIVVIGGAFLILAPSVAWMALLPMPFILWGSLTFQKFLAPRYADMREKVGLLNGRLTNNLSGITTIKSFTAEDYEAKRVEADSNAYRVSNAQAISLSAAFIPLIRMLILIGFTVLLVFGGVQVIEKRLAVGAYSSLVFSVQFLLWPLTRLGETFDLYQRAMASTNRVMNLLDTLITIHPGDVNLPVDMVRGAIEFTNVTFAYQGRTPVIKNLSLDIPAGHTIAIVGATGSGKSTLIKILLRFYEIQNGTITLDQIDLQNLNLRDLRRCIGLVSQDVFLFHGTVAENIAYGTFDATDEQIIQAAKIAEAEEFIQTLPQGYETIVGERGQKLSGGQKQRIAMAKRPP